jgi:two-component system LytT family response regulator
MSDRLRVLVVDDEPLARQRIEDLLAKEDDVEIAGTASTGDEAIEAIRTLDADLVFLDVQMPGKSGVEVVESVGVNEMPLVIFTTAYDKFAVKAFELAAVDYLVKPFDDERFVEALRRARKAFVREEDDEPRKYIEKIPVELRGQMRVVPVAMIDAITASGPYAELHVGERTFAIRERMQTLEEQLDPNVFFRIHRSAIVRLDRIDTLRRASGGDYAVRLKNGTELSVSRSRREELERRLLDR